MKTYIYPQNLKAASRLWLGELKIPGFSDYLHRTDIIGCDINADMVVYTVRNNGNVCVFVYTHGGNNDNGLYILCV